MITSSPWLHFSIVATSPQRLRSFNHLSLKMAFLLKASLSATQTMQLIEHLTENTYSHTHQIVAYVEKRHLDLITPSLV